MTTYYTTLKIAEPMGELTITSDGSAITGVYMESHRHGPIRRAEWVYAPGAYPLPEAVRQLEAYFASELKQFDLPLSAEGTTFQQSVWRELTRIPYGTTTSYGELAGRLGNPNASRAVGLANGRNPISIVIPCHRVIGASGKLVGYGGGLDRKVWLIGLESNASDIQPDQLTLSISGETP